jgi:alpha-tubulin suppressor-like RCC1 family protein
MICSRSTAHRRAGRPFSCVLLALALAACDAGRLFVDPAAPPGEDVSLSLSLSPSASAASGAAALFSSANQLRVQIGRGNTIVLDTAVSFRAADGVPSNILLPLARSASPATVVIEAELRENRRSLLRGSRSVQLQRRQLTTAEVELFPTNTPALASLAGISTGIFHSCAAKSDGRAYCWGDNLYGQLGEGSTGIRLTPAAVIGGRFFHQVNAGYVSSCGLGTDRRVYCWGENDRGVLGTTATARSTEPVPVATELNFEGFTMGGLHACGLTADGRAFCWGYNEFGQLGTGTTTDSSVPVASAPALRFSKLSAGYLHTCGLTQDGRAHCWGYNEYGQLGTESRVPTSNPVQIGGSLTFTDLSGGGLHTCGLTQDGRAYCWGYNEYGQLGTGAVGESQLVPVPVAGATRFRAVTAGGAHTCGLGQDGQILCWGYNSSGPLGTGNFTNVSQPTPILGGIRAHQIAAGLHHTCAMTLENQAMCWGFNRFGQLGDRSTVSSAEPGFVLDEATPPVGLAERNPEYPPALGILLGAGQ